MHVKSSKLSAFAIYLLLTGIAAFATNIIFAINMVYQIETVKLNPLQLVLVGTALEATCFLCQIPTGILADMYSRRRAVVIGYSLMGAGFVLEGLIPTFTIVLAAQVLWGAGATCVTGAEEAWCADEIGEERVGAAFIRATQIGQVASLLAIPLGIWLATYRLNVPVIVGGALLLLLGLFLLIVMPEQHFQPVPRNEHSSWRGLGQTIVNGMQAVSKSRMLLVILAITAFQAMSSEGFDRLQTDHFIKDFSFPALGHLSFLVWFGIINAGGMLLTLLATEIIRRRVDTHSHTAMIRVMFGLNVLLIISIGIFALAGNFYLALAAYWLAMISRRADAPLYNAWITRNSEPRIRATIFSMLGQIDAIGQIAGGPIVGYIGTVASLRAALLTTSAILSPCVIFFTQGLRISKRVPVYEEESEKGRDEVTMP